MGALAFSGPGAGAYSNEVPFGLRLRAWWNGDDPRDLMRRKAAPPSPPAPSPAPLPAAPAVADEDAAPSGPRPWPAERIAFVERLWGEGLHTPGGDEHLRELVKPMALNETMTMLDFGCGLGGGARTVAASFGTWCTGVEWTAGLAMAGVERSTRANLAKKAAIQFQSADRVKLKRHAFNGVFSKEALFTIPEKMGAIRCIADALKPGGELCVTDYVVSDQARDSFCIREWQSREPLGAHPWTLSEYRAAFAAYGFDMRVAEDMTGRHCQLIREGWQRLAAEMALGSVTPGLMSVMVREAEIWGLREALLRKGALRHYRFFAIKHH